MPLVKHRLSHTKSYEVWSNLRKRCNNPNAHNYARYGGRGITYSLEWEDFENFYKDMGDPPLGHQLDRKDNNQGYSKENCRWVLPQVNYENRGLYTSNNSGLAGVSYETGRNRWKTRVSIRYGNRILIYQGPDFFEAVCALKSWTNKGSRT